MFYGEEINKVSDVRLPTDIGRMCSLRLMGRYKEYSIIHVYAPKEEKDVADKDKFYEMLEQHIQRSPKTDVKIVVGDLSAKIGKDECYSPTIGVSSKHHSTNKN